MPYPAWGNPTVTTGRLRVWVRHGLAIALASALVCGVLPVSADGAIRVERLAGFDAAGTPAKYDRVGIVKVEPKRAPNILVLNPGTSASASYFAPLAQDIARKTRG
jgi:hypothetical protein